MTRIGLPVPAGFTISTEACDYFYKNGKKYPPEMKKQVADAQTKAQTCDTALSASTLYRFLKQRGLSERQLLAPQAHKKFEAEFSNQIWQADMLFGPWVRRPSGGRIQAFLHATLDDASRLIPHAQFYASQGLDACLDCLRQAMAARTVLLPWWRSTGGEQMLCST